ALERVVLPECLLERVELAVSGQTLDGRHLGAVRLDGEHQAGANALAVHEHGAGAAHPVLAADMGPREPELVAEEVDEEPPRLERLVVGDPVHLHLDLSDVRPPRPPGHLTAPPGRPAARPAAALELSERRRRDAGSRPTPGCRRSGRPRARPRGPPPAMCPP